MTEGRKLFAAHAFIPSDENCGHAGHITNKNYQRSDKLTTARVSADKVKVVGTFHVPSTRILAKA